MEIYLQTGNEQTGPYREEDVRAMVTLGRIARNDLAWQEGMSNWQTVEQVVDLPAKPLPPPLPKRSLVLPVGLPPPPARSQRSPPPSGTAVAKDQPASTMRTVSGVIALLLGLMTVFNVGGCMNAREKLATFQNGNDSLATTNMLVDTARGMHNGDPLMGISGLLDKANTLEDDYKSSRAAAWLCLIGTLLAGGVCGFSGLSQAR